MYRALSLISLFLTFATNPMLLQAQTDILPGAWSTPWGQMYLHRTDTGFRGTYTDDGGRVSLNIAGGVLQGYWAEDDSNQRCTTERLGSYHWGRLRQSSPITAAGFSLLWGYCEDGALDDAWAIGEKIDHVENAGNFGSRGILIDNWNRSFCGQTDTIRFSLPVKTYIGEFTTWIYWPDDVTEMGYQLYNNGRKILASQVQKDSCDPYQKSWCRGIDNWDQAFSAGNYVIKTALPYVCRNGGSDDNGFITLEGRPFSNSGDLQTNLLPGDWNTPWGQMNIYRTDNGFQGTYTDDGGRVSLNIVDGVLQGYWSEDDSNHRCARERLGSYHWGRLKLEAPISTDGFSILWGYCEDGALESTWEIGSKIR